MTIWWTDVSLPTLGENLRVSTNSELGHLKYWFNRFFLLHIDTFRSLRIHIPSKVDCQVYRTNLLSVFISEIDLKFLTYLNWSGVFIVSPRFHPTPTVISTFTPIYLLAPSLTEPPSGQRITLRTFHSTYPFHPTVDPQKVPSTPSQVSRGTGETRTRTGVRPYKGCQREVRLKTPIRDKEPVFLFVKLYYISKK